MTLAAIKTNIDNGVAVKAAIIGTSVGLGYYADHTTVGDDHISSLKISTGATDQNRFQVAYQEALLTCSTHSAQIMSWAQQFRNYLTGKNAASVVRNLSADGWDSNQHRGTGNPYAGDTCAAILAMSPRPEFVVVSCQINDRGHALAFSTFQANQRYFVNTLATAGICVVLAKDNEIDMSNWDIYGDEMDVIKTELDATYPGMIDVIDFRTPTRTAITINGGFAADLASAAGVRVMSDSLHPAQRGHDLMATELISYLHTPVEFVNLAIIQKTATGWRHIQPQAMTVDGVVNVDVGVMQTV